MRTHSTHSHPHTRSQINDSERVVHGLDMNGSIPEGKGDAGRDDV